MALCASIGLAGASAAPATGEVVRLRAYDTAGQRLPWSAFRARQTNGRGSRGVNDQLVDPDTLSPLASTPLYDVDGDPGFDWPGRPAALTLAWPSADGYDNLIVDVPAPGRHVFDVLAARSAVARLEDALSARPQRTARLRRLVKAARQGLRRASAARRESRRGAWGARSLRAAQAAMVELLAAAGRGARGRQWAVTFDRVPAPDAFGSVADLFGRDGWIRLVLDLDGDVAQYADAVDRAHRAGLRVTAELVDSSDMARLSEQAFRDRVARYVGALDADAWEVGNEVNLRGQGPGVAAKVAYAARYVKQHTRARTMLTLAWQLGEDDARYSTFGWLDANADALADIDDVGLSLYPDQNPLGASFERVMTTLHARLPGKRILVSELGYATPDGEPIWWWGDRRSPSAARRAVARFYQAAVMAFPFSGGGAYWWYFLDDAPRGSALWRTLRAAYTGGQS